MKVAGKKRKGWNGNNEQINLRAQKLFDITYPLDNIENVELNEANLEYIAEMRPKKKK